MKIIAEFNSTNEVLDFINAFGAGVVTSQITIDGAKVGTALEDIKESKKSSPIKEEVKTVEKEETQKVEKSNDVTEDKESEVVKITKEQIREVFSKLIKAGKQKEAKELTAKYGASKVGEVKEEDYAAILKDAEELL
ncbi:hypothetical protein [Clostridium nigeriense]|uniref:hypothetical protein n=1 Tax=Clostridium nigeriense TaxID=1805470 RepID=UPI00082B74B4|nr:hypothetical protein [Clostridium nigeriense]